MKTTVELRLQTTPEQFQALRATQEAYRDAWNYVSRYAFEQRVCTLQALRAATSLDVCHHFRLPSRWARRVIRDVGHLYQGLWKRVESHTLQRGDRRTTKRYTLLNQAPLYTTPQVFYQYGKDYHFISPDCISILTLDGRLSIPATCTHHHMLLIQQGVTIGEAILWYDQHHKVFSLRMTLEVTTPDPPHFTVTL